MKYTIPIAIFVFSLLVSCTNGSHKSGRTGNKLTDSNDTLIGTKVITDEIPGGTFRKRAKSYFLVIKNDTSAFKPIFTESVDGNSIGIHMNFQYFKRNITYRQLRVQLKKLMPEAAKEFNLDSLRSIFFGRLVLGGDLAIEMTKEYKQQFGQTDSIADHDQICMFLLKSRFASDLNQLFKPYSIYVKAFHPEKVWFTDKSDLYTFGNVESDSVSAPKRIFDCLMYIELMNANYKNNQ